MLGAFVALFGRFFWPGGRNITWLALGVTPALIGIFPSITRHSVHR